MKKVYNKELLISGIYSVVIIALTILLLKYGDFSAFRVENPNGDFSLFLEAGALAFAGVMILGILCLIAPGIGIILHFLFVLIARLFQIGQDKKWKNIVSLVFFILSLIIIALLIILYISIVVGIKEETYLIPLFISIGVFILMIIFYVKYKTK